MYETFAAVIAGTAGVLGYLLLSQDNELGLGFEKHAQNRRKWTGIVDGEPELEELCDEIMEVD